MGLPVTPAVPLRPPAASEGPRRSRRGTAPPAPASPCAAGPQGRVGAGRAARWLGPRAPRCRGAKPSGAHRRWRTPPRHAGHQGLEHVHRGDFGGGSGQVQVGNGRARTDVGMRYVSLEQDLGPFTQQRGVRELVCVRGHLHCPPAAQASRGALGPCGTLHKPPEPPAAGSSADRRNPRL